MADDLPPTGGYYFFLPGSLGPSAAFDVAVMSADELHATIDPARKCLAWLSSYQLAVKKPGLVLLTRKKKLIAAGVDEKVFDVARSQLHWIPPGPATVLMDRARAVMKLGGDARPPFTRSEDQSMDQAHLRISHDHVSLYVRHRATYNAYLIVCPDRPAQGAPP